MRYCGIKDNRIIIVTDRPFKNNDSECIEIPKDLSSIPSKDLIVDYRYRDGKFFSSIEPKERSSLRIAIVSNFKQQCGISTYIENLLPYILPQVGDYRLFIEETSVSTGNFLQVGDFALKEGSCLPCWKRGEGLSRLVEEIKKFKPDIIWFQHEYGLWSNARHWLAMMTQLRSYRTIVTLHSIYHHKDKSIIEASIPEAVVHLQGAVDLLKREKKVGGKVWLIPHGCGEVKPGRLWNLYKSKETFIQLGFGFRYKRFEEAIKATAILKQKYKDIFFTALFSKSPNALMEHEVYRNELMELIERLDLRENVAILDGFQSDETIDAYLRTNQVATFLYGMDPQHEVYGASGASRLAMTTGMPIISSSIPHFSDMPTLKANNAEELAHQLDLLFSSEEEKVRQVERQNEWLKGNGWSLQAEKYLKVFENRK